MSGSVYDELALLFEDFDYLWSTTEGPIVPSAEDIEKVVDAAAGRLYDSRDGSTIETGRLIIQKVSTTKYAIYLHIGDTQ